MTEPLHISASQLGTFHDCKRKWWLEKVARMPSVPKGYLIFGTVLHACLERWASADALGRGPDGQVVTAFPPGWETVEEGGQRLTITPNEAALIRRLVDQAIERGIVQRGDGRVLEREIRLPVIEGVDLVGFIDVFVPLIVDDEARTQNVLFPEIEDHKTFGEGSVRFLKQPAPTSPNYLGADRQLLTYAAATARIDGWAGPVVVRHNQFPKFEDGKGPRTVEAVVPPDVIAEHWAGIQATAAEMVRVKAIKRWDDVPGPVEADTCQKYGGCPFREICGRRSTLDGYKGRVEKQLAEAKAPRPDVSLQPRKGTPKNMSNDLFANARGRRGAQPAQPQPERETATTGTPAVSTQPVAAPSINGGAPAPAAPMPPAGGPPWANPNCTACKGTGFNSKGRPCPICDALAKKLKRPMSSLYLVEGDLQAGFTATERPEKVAEIYALGAPQSWSSKDGAAPAPVVNMEAARAHVAQVAVEQPQEIRESTPSPAAASAPAPAATAPVETPAVENAKRGRKPASFSVYIGCVPLKGPDRPTETAQGLLHRLGIELAKDMGAASYWELDAFKRRDRIKQRSAEIAEGLGRTILLVAGVRDPDVDSLVSSLLPHAETVVEGLR